jgi:uncharacterized repeat protein (TIGR02543 family)
MKSNRTTLTKVGAGLLALALVLGLAPIRLGFADTQGDAEPSAVGTADAAVSGQSDQVTSSDAGVQAVDTTSTADDGTDVVGQVAADSTSVTSADDSASSDLATDDTAGTDTSDTSATGLDSDGQSAIQAAEDISLFSAVLVSTEAELRDAVVNAPDNTLTTIELTNDIQLTGVLLKIPSNKIITLTGSFKLVGADADVTLYVDDYAVLTIDGITVTHNAGGIGNGIYVRGLGELILKSGAISGNTTVTSGLGTTGAGVFNLGDFTMNGGEISNNKAYSYGGGVDNTGTFTMNGGTISDNIAEGGLGLGGGIFTYNYYTVIINGGEISNNTAGTDGGGIYAGRYNDLTISKNVVFSNNKASAIHLLTPDDTTNYAIYQQNILATSWSDSLATGFNNYDINYTEGVEYKLVTFNNNYTGAPAATIVPAATNTSLEDNMPAEPTREGYTFLGWNTKADGTGDVFTSATEVDDSIEVYAQWELVTGTQEVTSSSDQGPTTTASTTTTSTVTGSATPATGDNTGVILYILAALSAIFGYTLLVFSLVKRSSRQHKRLHERQ